MSDVRVDWSPYRKAMVATITTRSVVTENPSTREAAILAAFAESVPIETPALVDSLACTFVSRMYCPMYHLLKSKALDDVARKLNVTKILDIMIRIFNIVNA